DSPTPAPADTFTRSLHDALPIYPLQRAPARLRRVSLTSVSSSDIGKDRLHTSAGPRSSRRSITSPVRWSQATRCCGSVVTSATRSEEHTSELQSLTNLLCPLLLE